MEKERAYVARGSSDFGGTRWAFIRLVEWKSSLIESSDVLTCSVCTAMDGETTIAVSRTQNPCAQFCNKKAKDVLTHMQKPTDAHSSSCVYWEEGSAIPDRIFGLSPDQQQGITMASPQLETCTEARTGVWSSRTHVVG